MGRAYGAVAAVLAAALLIACGSGGSSHSTTPPPPTTRTVTVNWTDTYWSPNGPVKVPQPASAAAKLQALVPQTDGSITLLQGSATSTPGVFVVPNVPTGNYWLAAGGGNAYWTNTSTFDAGRDIAGGQLPFTSTANATTLDFNVTGLSGQTAEEFVEFFTDPPSGFILFGVPPGITSVGGSFTAGGYTDWSQIPNGYLMQYELEPLGSLNNYVLGPELALSLALTDGATNTIAGTLNPASENSLNLSVSGSQWASAFNNVGPATATVQDSILTLTAEAYVTGVNAGPESVLYPGLTLVGPSPGGLGLFQLGQLEYLDPVATFCGDFTGDPSQDVVPINPPLTTDQNFGALQYSDPFDPSWTRALALCQQATVPITIPDSSVPFNFLLVDGGSVAPSNSPLAPVALPVQNPTIGGTSLFTPSTVATATPTLSWTAPSGTAPYGYKVIVFVLPETQGPPELEELAIYNTAGTSVTLPPLAGGNIYILTITTEVDGAANMQTSPLRSALPTGFASVVSAPITLSPSAATPEIHGDIEEWRRLVTPKRDRPGRTKSPVPGSTCAWSGTSIVSASCQ